MPSFTHNFTMKKQLPYNLLIEKIHIGVSPYAGYPKEQWPTEQFSGWGSIHHWFKELIERLRPELIIEVGTFLGGSAIHMGECLRNAKINDSAILCIDTWLAEQILWSMAEHRVRLKIQYGRPCFYYTFLSNVIEKGLQGTIVPLPMPSQSAARYLKELGGITAKLIYIDGCHEEGDCYRDLNAYWQFLEPGGAMLVDDYNPENPMFFGLVKDVNQFCLDRELKREVSECKALLWKK